MKPNIAIFDFCLLILHKETDRQTERDGEGEETRETRMRLVRAGEEQSIIYGRCKERTNTE